MRVLILILLLILISAFGATMPNRRLNFQPPVASGGISNTPVVVASNLWATANSSGTQFNMTISGYHPLVYIAVTTFSDASNMGVTNLTTGLVLTQRYKTNSYNNQVNSFSGFCDTNPANGVNTYIVTNSPGSLSEFAGIAILITNGINVFGATNIVRNTSNKTGITNTVTSVSNNLVLHFVGHNTTGSGSFDGTQTL